MSKRTHPAPVVVTWNDAWSCAEAYTASDVAAEHRPQVTRSAGFLVRSDRVGVSIAGCVDMRDGETFYDRVLFIPRGMVVSVRRP